MEYKKLFFNLKLLSSCPKDWGKYYGLNDSKAVNEILKQETSITDFELGLLNYKYIDSLALNTKRVIIEDSISFYNKWIKNNREFKYMNLTGKRTIYHCLDYYKSNELDSIAKSRIKKMKF